MAKSPAGTSKPVIATALGIAASLAVLVAHLGGLDGGIERQTLDLRFRHFSNAPVQTDIVHIEIDDASLERFGRWPWPRRRLARIVEILQQCGARAVAVDIIMPEPQETRYASAAEELYSGDIAELIGDAPPARIFDDDAMAAMLARYDNVTLPMHIYWRSDAEAEDNALPARISDLLDKNGEMSFETLRRNLDPNISPVEARPKWAKEYLKQRALKAIKRLSIDPKAIGDCSARPGDLVPPMVRFALEIKRTGFVSFEPDPDGVARRIPLLSLSGGRIYPQFALSLAADKLSANHGGEYSITADASAVTIRCGDGEQVRIPVDDEGFMLINWAYRRKETRISASAVAAIVQLKDDIEQAGKLIRHYQIALLKLLYPGEHLGQVPAARLLAEADRLYEMQVAAQIQRQRAALYDPANVPPPPTDLLQRSRLVEAEIDLAFVEELQDLRDPELFESSLGPLPAPPTGPANDAAASDYQRKLAQYEARKASLINLMEQLERLPRVQRIKQDEIADLLTRLRRRITGKTVIIGSTATGAADFVPTPLEPRTPGMVVHSNIVNTIVNEAFVNRSSVWAEIAAILLAGGVISVLAASRPVLQTGPLTAAMAFSYAAFNAAVVFGVLGVWLVMAAPLAAMFASLLVVTAYRQLTEERAKRHIRAMFSHALSPTLVDKLLSDPTMANLGGERRVLSCFFSDLQGFTALSERLGEQKTVRLLNHYFDHMTEVIQDQCGGYLNKFLGDGLFVFFGAPVLQDDHAARAVRAAIKCQQEIKKLNIELREEFGHDAELACRIGVTTGEVMVGNCGSTQRMDYTAIGDSVNLASRLESANKFFGTRILVDGRTWREGGSGALARPLGKVLVVGKNEAVEVWNVLVESEDTSAKQVKSLAGQFAHGVDLFAASKFAEAVECFEAVLAAAPDDKTARVYADLARRYQADPPPGDWNGAVQLTEK